MKIDPTALARVRRKARRHGFYITKSRQQLHSNNYGGLMLTNGWDNTVLEGVYFDLTTDHAEYWIDRYATEGKGCTRRA